METAVNIKEAGTNQEILSGVAESSGSRQAEGRGVKPTVDGLAGGKVAVRVTVRPVAGATGDIGAGIGNAARQKGGEMGEPD